MRGWKKMRKRVKKEKGSQSAELMYALEARVMIWVVASLRVCLHAIGQDWKMAYASVRRPRYLMHASNSWLYL